jgi:hypothetical protein
MKAFDTPLTAITPDNLGSFAVLLGGIERAIIRKVKEDRYKVKIADCCLDYVADSRDEAIAYTLGVLWPCTID